MAGNHQLFTVTDMKRRLIIVFLLLICFTGCQKKPAGFPDVYPCTVKVTNDGKAMSRITVHLNRQGGQGAWTAMGETNGSGVATIKTTWADFTAAGVPEGTYKVILTEKLNIPDDGLTPGEMMALEGKALEEYHKKREEEKSRVRTLPKIVNLSSTTPLTLEVTTGKGGELTVDIKDYADLKQ